MKCRAAQLPGKNLGTLDVKRYGPIRKIANDVMFEPINLTFTCDKYMTERKFFDAWLSFIHGQDQISGFDETHQFRPKYYDEYIGVGNLNMLSDGHTETYSVRLVDMYPTTMSPIELAWGTNGEIATFTVTMIYRYWHDAGATIHTAPEVEPDPPAHTKWHIIPGAPSIKHSVWMAMTKEQQENARHRHA